MIANLCTYAMPEGEYYACERAMMKTTRSAGKKGYVSIVRVSVDPTRSSTVGLQLSTTAIFGSPGGSSSLGDIEAVDAGIVGSSTSSSFGSSSSGIVGDKCFAIASLAVGDGGDVLSGDTDAAYCELVNDIAGDPLSDDIDANGELDR